VSADNGKVALVTGASRGIGRAIAEALAARGYTVHGCARNPLDAVPAGVAFHRCDVADADAVRAMVAAIGAGAGRIDLLVNNAGIAGSNPLDADADDGLWHAIVATNLTGTYLCAKAALPLLPDGAGRIVNIASVLGLRGAADQTAYCAAKHGVIGFTRALALAMAPRGITVNAVCPGWVATDMAAQRYREMGIDADTAAADTPLGRVATPEDVAGAVLFLAGPDAGHITGQTLTVDGGTLA
jgi:NAD(P)-dependent dehydrogenase (short-subunit alcohol dehydrogenase family)